MAEPIFSHLKLEGFDLTQTDYKQIGEHGIRADILVPRTLHTGKRPVLIRLHGGGLVMGDSLFMDFYPHWLSDLALLHGAVIISPNYRLMPEATSLEIFDDVEDFWAWLHSQILQDLLAPTGLELDLSRILTVGESAGGLLSISLALAHPVDVRAAIAAYPMVIDQESPDYTTPREVPPFGHHVPESVIEDVISSIIPRTATTKSSITSPASLRFMLAVLQHGRILGLYERGAKDTKGSSLRREVRYLMERLEQPDIQIPRGGIAVIHGRQDSVVPVLGSERFVARAREITGSDKVVLAIRDGDHGFDSDLRFGEEPWLQESLKTAVETWLE